MKIWSKEEEGQALRKRFDDLKKNSGISRAAFARQHGLKGGDSIIYQHITGHRPMSIDAAIVYAKGFACELHDISPRLALEAKEMAVAIGSGIDHPAKNQAPLEFGDELSPLSDIQTTSNSATSQHDNNKESAMLVAFPIAGAKSVKSLDHYLIPQYGAGGAMGHGLQLPDQPGVIQNWNVSKEWMNKNVRNISSPGNLCIVTGFGHSMQPMFNPGDPLLVDIGVKSVIADGIYFFRVGTEGFVKQLQKIPTPAGLKYVAKSKNADFDPFEITPDMDFEVLGKVVRVWCGTDF